MLKTRLIAVILVHRGNLVQTRGFRRSNVIGSAYEAVDFFNSWSIDEIVVLNVSEDDSYTSAFFELIDQLSRRCFVPLAVGGKINSLQRMHQCLQCGADKIVLNSAAVLEPDLVRQGAEKFGRQCMVVSIDGLVDDALPSGYRAVIRNGSEPTDMDAVEWAATACDAGAGEILVNSVTHDGMMNGYDMPLIRAVSDRVEVPVIAMGGVGRWQHLIDGIRDGRADAVAAGNIFHYTEHSTRKAKEAMAAAGIPVRLSGFHKPPTKRRPVHRLFGPAKELS